MMSATFDEGTARTKVRAEQLNIMSLGATSRGADQLLCRFSVRLQSIPGIEDDRV